MFDLISGPPRHPFHEPTVAPTVVSILGHGALLLTVAGASFLASKPLPQVPDMLAFVAAAPVPAPPPPPPARRAAPARPAAVPAVSRTAAPVEAPSAVVAETFVPADEDVEGVEGGVEGGIAGGVLGGVIGGLVATPLPPPPPPAVTPPPAPERPAPVRIGGQITAPGLVKRVEPDYPEIARVAKLSGIVILEAVVGLDGAVETVTVLRSVRFLDAAAVEAVKQWRYSPLLINGIPTPFILTVSLSFRFKD